MTLVREDDHDVGARATGGGTGRGNRTAVWLLWLSSTAFVAGAVALTVPAITAGAVDEGERLGMMFLLVVPVVLAAVGAVVAARRPRHPIGWLLLVSGWLFALSACAGGYAEHASGAVELWAGVVRDVAFFPAFVLVGFLLPLVFPDGRLPSRRWRPVAWGMTVAATAETLTIPLRALAETQPAVTAAAQASRTLAAIAFVLFPPVMVAVAVAIVMRFRRAQGTARLQFKWVALPAVLFFIFVMINESGLVTGAVGEVALGLMFVVGFGGLPVGVGVAVLRYRLYAIDRLVSRTLGYGALTVVVVGIYVAGVVGLGAAVRAATGSESSDLVVAASTLAVAAVFQPARRRIQTGVERRFNRSRYDAQRTVEAFARRLRDEVDARELTDDLYGVVAATVEPAGMSLWLRPAPEP